MYVDFLSVLCCQSTALGRHPVHTGLWQASCWDYLAELRADRCDLHKWPQNNSWNWRWARVGHRQKWSLHSLRLLTINWDTDNKSLSDEYAFFFFFLQINRVGFMPLVTNKSKVLHFNTRRSFHQVSAIIFFVYMKKTRVFQSGSLRDLTDILHLHANTEYTAEVCRSRIRYAQSYQNHSFFT